MGNTAVVWPYFSSRSDGCSPFMPSEHGMELVAALEVCTRDGQCTVVCVFVCVFCHLKV